MPAPGRVEDRTVDGSCNPYLAATVLLAAGLDGIERELECPEPNPMNLYESTAEQRAELGISTLPENLLDATRALEADDVLRKALGGVTARQAATASEAWRPYRSLAVLHLWTHHAIDPPR